MNRKLTIARDQRGAAILEFALLAPVLITFIIGIAQLGILFFANADMRNAVAAGARVASVYPRPSDRTIIRAVNERVIGLDSRHIKGPTVTHDVDSNQNPYAVITMSYAVPLDFVFVETPPITLTETRRVFTQPSES